MLKRRIAALVMAVVASLVAVAVAQPAHAFNVPPAPGDWAELFPPFFSSNPSRCLDMPNGSNSPGLQVQVFRCHGYANNGHPQRWLFRPDGNEPNGEPVFLIKNVASDLCLAVDGTGLPGTAVTQRSCFAGSSLQRWFLETGPVFGENFALRSSHNRANCLATANSSGANNTNVVVARCLSNVLVDPTTIRQIWAFG